MGMLDSFLHPEDAYQAASDALREAQDKAIAIQKPYLDAGTAQLPQLTGAEGQLLDPETLQNKWASGYEMSPYAKQLIDQSKSAGLDEASSQGLLGSSAALGNIQTNASNIMRGDRQQYLQDLMQKYMAGIGIGQNIYNTGASTAGNVGNQVVQTGQNLAGTEYGRVAAPGAMLGNILGKIGGAALNYGTGGMSGMAGMGGFGGGANMPAYAQNAIMSQGQSVPWGAGAG